MKDKEVSNKQKENYEWKKQNKLWKVLPMRERVRNRARERQTKRKRETNGEKRKRVITIESVLEEKNYGG